MAYGFREVGLGSGASVDSTPGEREWHPRPVGKLRCVMEGETGGGRREDEESGRGGVAGRGGEGREALLVMLWANMVLLEEERCEVSGFVRGGDGYLEEGEEILGAVDGVDGAGVLRTVGSLREILAVDLVNLLAVVVFLNMMGASGRWDRPLLADYRTWHFPSGSGPGVVFNRQLVACVKGLY